MAEPTHQASLPRGALIGLGLLIALSLALAFTARSTGLGRVTTPVATSLERRDLLFHDLADGTLEIRDAASGSLVHAVAPGSNEGFLRAAMRGLARERKRNEGGPETPFRLERWSDGRLSICDPVTSQCIDLVAFGATNAAAFARLLPRKETRS